MLLLTSNVVWAWLMSKQQYCRYSAHLLYPSGLVYSQSLVFSSNGCLGWLMYTGLHRWRGMFYVENINAKTNWTSQWFLMLFHPLSQILNATLTVDYNYVMQRYRYMTCLYDIILKWKSVFTKKQKQHVVLFCWSYLSMK